jgi:hypothetical protein
VTTVVELARPTDVPSKCPGHGGPGIPANPCIKPGSLLRCMVCPQWSGYWRKRVA